MNYVKRLHFQSPTFKILLIIILTLVLADFLTPVVTNNNSKCGLILQVAVYIRNYWLLSPKKYTKDTIFCAFENMDALLKEAQVQIITKPEFNIMKLWKSG